jgi:hypothetical protein
MEKIIESLAKRLKEMYPSKINESSSKEFWWSLHPEFEDSIKCYTLRNNPDLYKADISLVGGKTGPLASKKEIPELTKKFEKLGYTIHLPVVKPLNVTEDKVRDYFDNVIDRANGNSRYSTDFDIQSVKVTKSDTEKVTVTLTVNCSLDRSYFNE